MANKFAVITGASSGIGFELALIAAENGYDILVVAEEPAIPPRCMVSNFVYEAADAEFAWGDSGQLTYSSQRTCSGDHGSTIDAAAAAFRQFGTDVQSVEADLATIEGVDKLLAAVAGRRIDVLCANAGSGTGGAFLDQPVQAWRQTIDTNITGTLYLLHTVLGDMVARGDGKILVTGSIAGYVPGAFNATYNATKAFINNFTDAVRNEIKDVDGVTLTTLMPGATETEFFDRAGMRDTAVGAADKADPAKVANDGWDALMAGKPRIVSGFFNKLQVAASGVVPPSILAEAHRHIAEPGSANKN